MVISSINHYQTFHFKLTCLIVVSGLGEAFKREEQAASMLSFDLLVCLISWRSFMLKMVVWIWWNLWVLKIWNWCCWWWVWLWECEAVIPMGLLFCICLFFCFVFAKLFQPLKILGLVVVLYLVSFVLSLLVLLFCICWFCCSESFPIYSVDTLSPSSFPLLNYLLTFLNLSFHQIMWGFIIH